MHATRHNAIEGLTQLACRAGHLPVRAFARRYWPFGDVERMYHERGAWRATWYALIARALHGDPGGLAREVLRRHEIYTGVHSRAELAALRREHPHVRCYWVQTICITVPHARELHGTDQRSRSGARSPRDERATARSFTGPIGSAPARGALAMNAGPART